MRTVCSGSQIKSRQNELYVHVHNCIPRGGKCCQPVDSKDHNKWIGEAFNTANAKTSDYCGLCWTGKTETYVVPPRDTWLKVFDA